MAAMRRGATPEDITRHTLMDPWFIKSMKRIIRMEELLLGLEIMTPSVMWEAKRLGFSDEQLAMLGVADGLSDRVRTLRKSWGICPVFKMVDTCAAEFEAVTPYYYSTYEQENEADPFPGSKAVVLGSGPIRIGQGIEFDYCSVHAAWALQDENISSILINSNPETVSTDFDTSNRLYFEPLDQESVLDILENETPESGTLPSTVVQFGGQTAINLSQVLDQAGFPIMGSSARTIDVASDRGKFEEFLEGMGIPQPPGAVINSVDEALQVAGNIGYPVLVRPSYVLGGRAMEIIQEAGDLGRYVSHGLDASPGRPILVDKYLEGRECELDAISDGETVVIPGIMEHVERAGVHSGDSMAVYPTMNLSPEEINTIVDYATRICIGLEIRGLMNIQFVIMGGNSPQIQAESLTAQLSKVYVLEVNSRASRTVPFLSKVTGIPMVRMATQVMVGKTLKQLGYQTGLAAPRNLVAIKAPVFSMSKLAGVDSYLGPEMKSTGEVMGIDSNYQAALAKALLASGMLPIRGGAVLLSIADKDKPTANSLIKRLIESDFQIYATEGTSKCVKAIGFESVKMVSKIGTGNPNVVDLVEGRMVDMVVNTMSGTPGQIRDGFQIRRAAVERRIPCFTSLDTANAALEALRIVEGQYQVKSQKEYLSMI